MLGITKGSMITVTFKSGISKSLTTEIEEGTTLGGALAKRELAAVLGYGENVGGQVNGTLEDDSYTLEDGDVVTIVTKATTKA